MPSFRTKRRVNHAADEMFALVADMERYPEFVPLCQHMRVRGRTQVREGVEVCTAVMTVAYKLISETFTTRVTLDKPGLAIKVEYINGPFSILDNRWSFHPVTEQSCDVEFFISYEFKSRMLGLVMGAMFDVAFRKFAHAFERRADVVYGKRRHAPA
ncbi:MAG: type II toxin-antitoxin system RatA family toxin [Xanthobacteraceae bacterium]